MYWCLVFRRAWYCLFQTLLRIPLARQIIESWLVQTNTARTNFSKTHAFSNCSGLLQCHNDWLLFSRHCQCFRNWSRQFLLMSSNLPIHNFISQCHSRTVVSGSSPESSLLYRRALVSLTPKNVPETPHKRPRAQSLTH